MMNVPNSILYLTKANLYGNKIHKVFLIVNNAIKLKYYS